MVSHSDISRRCESIAMPRPDFLITVRRHVVVLGSDPYDMR